MWRRAKVELFEELRRECEFGAGTIKGVATKLGVHPRMVRPALGSAEPRERLLGGCGERIRRFHSNGQFGAVTGIQQCNQAPNTETG